MPLLAGAQVLVWCAAVLAAATAAPASAGRATDRACGLNGVFNEASSSCKCFKGWKGRTCSELNLAPASPAAYGVHNASNPTWGGTAFFEDGRWHAVVGARALQIANNSLDNYPCNSHIVRAETEGSDPAGPWRIVETVIPRISWEPGLTRMPDGGLLMLFFGNLSANKLPVGAPPCFTTHPALLGSTTYATVSRSGSVMGPWTEPIMVRGMRNELGTNITIAGRGSVRKDACDWYCSNANPGPAYHPNGTLFAVIRGYNCDPSCGRHEHIGLWRADDGWDGEWTLVTPEPLFGWGNATSSTCNRQHVDNCPTNEDPHLWIDRSGGFHVLSHFQNNNPFRMHRGSYGWSKDGLDWVLETLPLHSEASAWDPNVTWTNGSHTLVSRRQRPSLIFDPDTGELTHLLNGADFLNRTQHGDPPNPWCEGCHWGTGMTLIQPLQ